MSSSTYITDLDPEDTRLIEDTEALGENFTDGCGYMSEALMKLVAEKFDVHKTSAIQMRYGGFKGVLVEHPGLDGQFFIDRKPYVGGRLVDGHQHSLKEEEKSQENKPSQGIQPAAGKLPEER